MFPDPRARAAEQPVLITATVDTHALPESKFIIIVTFTLHCSKENNLKNSAVTQESEIPTLLSTARSLQDYINDNP